MEKDLRQFLRQCREAGNLTVVKSEVDPITQLGSLCDQSKTPIVFEKVRGYPDWTVCAELTTSRRSQAIALGLPRERLVPELAQRFRQGYTPWVEVKDAPVQEVRLEGEGIDLGRLPVARHSEKDGGRTIGGGMNITRDRETGIQNAACLRMELQDRNHTGLLMVPRHSWRHFQQYESRGEPCPMAVAIGGHPALDIATSWSIPYGVDEFTLAGTLMEEPVEMVRALTVDLMVPARAEIVIEGHVLPGARRPEGPFGEFQCYYQTGRGLNPVFEATCITLRGDAIYRHTQATNFVEHQSLVGLPQEVELFCRLSEVDGSSEILDVYSPPFGGNFLLVVQMVPHFEGQVKNVLLSAMGSPYLHPKVVLAVDDDIDITEPQDLLWSLATRVNPAEDIILVPGTRNHPMDPSLPQISPPGTRWQRVGGKMGVDATKPSTWREEERKEFERTHPMGEGKVWLEALELASDLAAETLSGRDKRHFDR
ncbi:MAG: UbiD family decarboxylase [Nitrospinota bacterium]